MSTTTDRFTVTFDGEKAVKIATEFRKIVAKRKDSVNRTLKEMIHKFVKKEK